MWRSTLAVRTYIDNSICKTRDPKGGVLQALFFTYGGMEPGTASVVAEMLGFNPELVMPQLHRELDVAQQTDASRQQ